MPRLSIEARQRVVCLLARGYSIKNIYHKSWISNLVDQICSCWTPRSTLLKSQYVTLYWLTNGILVLLTAEHWSQVYQSINVVLEKNFLRVSPCMFCSTCVLPRVCFHFHVCTSTRRAHYTL